MSELSPNRLFHTIVMLGAAAGVACGGSIDPPPTSGDSTTGNEATGGASSATGGTTSTGGIVLDPAGGSSGISLGTGGTTNWLSEELRGCLLEQWSCAPEAVGSCNDALLDPALCHCDATRPTAADQCPEGTTFVCNRLTLLPTDEGRGMQCSCVSDDAACECGDRNWSNVAGCSAGLPYDSVLCGGCSAIVLK